MKKFLIKALILISGIILIFLIAVLLPVSAPRQNLLYTQIDKNRLLKNTSSPRIIFIGGSNLAYGLDSKTIKDSLHINPINTGIHINIGLKYMLANALPYLKKGDIVVLSAEYQQFYGDLADGELELLSVITDIDPKSKTLLDWRQCWQMAQLLPEYTQTKLRPFLLHYTYPPNTGVGVYDRAAFNIYGDAYAHWNLPGQQYKPYPTINQSFNKNILNCLLKFRNTLKQKGAVLLVTFPAYQYSSYKQSIARINDIEQHLHDNNFRLISTPKEFVMADSLTFDTPYHLTKKGVELRTRLLIRDLKAALTKNKF